MKNTPSTLADRITALRVLANLAERAELDAVHHRQRHPSRSTAAAEDATAAARTATSIKDRTIHALINQDDRENAVHHYERAQKHAAAARIAAKK